MGYQLGIDVGTTYTAAAVCRAAGRYWVEPEVVTLGTRAATILPQSYGEDDTRCPCCLPLTRYPPPSPPNSAS